MLEEAALCGINPPALVYRMTFRELAAASAAAQRRRRHELADRLTAAWHMAGFSRAKRIPSLESILNKLDRKEIPERTDEDMVAYVEMLNQMFGGKDIRGQAKEPEPPQPVGETLEVYNAKAASG